MPDPIKKITLRDGTTRYRFVIDIGYEPQTDKATGEVVTDPATGKPKMRRKQLTVTKGTKREARDELARIRHQRSAGTYVAPTKTTVNALLDMWLKSATRDGEEATASNYDNAIRPVRKHLGHKPVQELSEEDVEAFIDWMVTEGRQRGGSPERASVSAQCASLWGACAPR